MQDRPQAAGGRSKQLLPRGDKTTLRRSCSHKEQPCKIYAHIYNRGRETGRDAIEELQLKTQPELHHIPNYSYSGGKKLQRHYQGDKRRSTLDAVRYQRPRRSTLCPQTSQDTCDYGEAAVTAKTLTIVTTYIA